MIEETDDRHLREADTTAEPLAGEAVGVRSESLPVSATKASASSRTAAQDEFRNESQALATGVAGWLLPGLGHALQRMWGRALIVFFAVGSLVYTGASMRGNVFTSTGSDAFDYLGYVADLGTGFFYFLARSIEKNGADVSHAGGDYGTRLLATAGVLNLLAALHAYEAARGRKA
jgi:hypothetical protein